MSRYIDADEQMTRIKQVYESMGVDTHGIWNKQLAEAFKGSDVETIRMCLHAILGAITQAPSIDIVRCKECRYKRIYDDGETKYYYCALEDRPNRQWSVDETDYCSWGEREVE